MLALKTCFRDVSTGASLGVCSHYSTLSPLWRESQPKKSSPRVCLCVFLSVYQYTVYLFTYPNMYVLCTLYLLYVLHVLYAMYVLCALCDCCCCRFSISFSCLCCMRCTIAVADVAQPREKASSGTSTTRPCAPSLSGTPLAATGSLPSPGPTGRTGAVGSRSGRACAGSLLTCPRRCCFPRPTLASRAWRGCTSGCMRRSQDLRWRRIWWKGSSSALLR